MGDFDIRVWMLYDGAGLKDGMARRIYDELVSRDLPKLTLKPGEVNMWWRPKTPSLYIQSSLEGSELVSMSSGTSPTQASSSPE